MSYVVRLILVLLLLTGSLWAFSSNTYLSWVKPSYVHSVYIGDVNDKYDMQEKIKYRFNGLYCSELCKTTKVVINGI